MITNFKIFESINKFKEGDYIYCINSDHTLDLDEDKKYQIVRILPGYDERDILILKGLLSSHFIETRFVSEEEYTENKYNL
jgi:hypothetical protein